MKENDDKIKHIHISAESNKTVITLEPNEVFDITLGDEVISAMLFTI